jgi:hypothetical protein
MLYLEQRRSFDLIAADPKLPFRAAAHANSGLHSGHYTEWARIYTLSAKVRIDNECVSKMLVSSECDHRDAQPC